MKTYFEFKIKRKKNGDRPRVEKKMMKPKQEMVAMKNHQKVIEMVNKNEKRNPAKVIENLHMTMKNMNNMTKWKK